MFLGEIADGPPNRLLQVLADGPFAVERVRHPSRDHGIHQMIYETQRTGALARRGGHRKEQVIMLDDPLRSGSQERRFSDTDRTTDDQNGAVVTAPLPTNLI